MALRLTIKGADQLRETAEALRRGKGTLRQELTKALKAGGDETLRKLKRNAETMSIRGRRHGGRRFTDHRAGNRIRHRIARITELEVSTGAGNPHVAFVVRSDRLADIRATNLPWHFDSGRTFRHPIMGNREAWAGQSGQPWFYDDARDSRDLFAKKCDEAIDKTIQSIERSK